MAVLTLNIFKTNSGRMAEHIAASAEAIGHLHRLGLQAMATQPIAGGDVGSLLTTINFADNAAHATCLQILASDDGWQEFIGRVMTDPPAELVESTILTDVDSSFRPSTERPLGVISATQWRAIPGRAAEFMAHVETGTHHIARLGGNPRVMQSIIGRHPLSVLISIGYDDLDSYGESADKMASDEQFQGFMIEIAANPTADLIRTGLYLNLG